MPFDKRILDAYRVPAAVKNRYNSDQFALNSIVHRIGKPHGQRSVKSPIGFGVYAGVKHEGIDVGEKAIEKIGTNPRCLSLVEAVSIEQVLLGGAGQ